ncbi:MAG: hypothetical protein E6Q88_11560 [Lysobacteraceae bacterium]|nr:MAG: hypothetical protein E6Q88_11560 [Xanthomonadaceae bacterium]
MPEMTKAEFKAMYFWYGREKDGWGEAYWDRMLEPEPSVPMRYLFTPPQSERHTRMMIVTDHAANEHRMFFLTEEDEEQFFDKGIETS